MDGLIASQKQGGIEPAVLTDVDLLGAVEADGDRLPGFDPSSPACSGQGVTEESVAESRC